MNEQVNYIFGKAISEQRAIIAFDKAKEEYYLCTPDVIKEATSIEMALAMAKQRGYELAIKDFVFI